MKHYCLLHCTCVLLSKLKKCIYDYTHIFNPIHVTHWITHRKQCIFIYELHLVSDYQWGGGSYNFGTI
jgi:hypothetical protein